jgi:hypothetical protein
MKLHPALLLVVGLSGALAMAQTTPPPTKIQLTPAAPAKDAKGAPAAKDGKAAPAKDPKKDAKKKEEEMGKTEGMEIARANGGFLGVRLVDGAWRVTFYNAKRKPVPPDVARMALRWDAKYKLGEERVVLNPGGDANSMTHPKIVRPPLTFKLFITLLASSPDGTDAASENYNLDFRG